MCSAVLVGITGVLPQNVFLIFCEYKLTEEKRMYLTQN